MRGAPHRHQFGNRVADRQFGRHRLRDPIRYGEGGRRDGQERHARRCGDRGSARLCRTCRKEIADSLDLDRPAGTLVTDVTAKSPAERAGLRQGDLIVAVDGQPTDDVEAFSYRFATVPLGGKAILSIVRDSKPLTLTIKPSRRRICRAIRSRSPVRHLSPVRRSSIFRRRLPRSIRWMPPGSGVVISDVDEESRAAALKLAKGRRHHRRQQQEDR